MRLSKKIAAVALAAVMSVSLLTACGDNDAPSSSNPGSSSGSSSSSADSSSSSGSASDSSSSNSSSSNSSSGSSSNSSTEDKEETVAYKDSRTGRFYQKLGTSYTLGMKMDFTANDESGTVDMLNVTSGGRSYQQATIQSKGSTESQMILLIDKTKQKIWTLIPNEELKEQGKLGCYYSGGVSNEVVPVEGLKFKKETKGNYYIETQSYPVPAHDGKGEIVMAFYYEGNSSEPKYVDVKESLGSEESLTGHMTFTRIEYTANAKYLDFETILNQYVDITDKMPSTVQAREPSVASLILG